MSLSLSSAASDPERDAFISSLDITVIRRLALEARHAQLRGSDSLEQHSMLESDLSCSVVSPPMSGSYNIVYELQFSDATSWAIRIPTISEWGPSNTRSMQLDIIAMKYITGRTSVPIPALHAHSCDTDNPLQHPYMIMDMVRGPRLCDVWYDTSWWSGGRTKENLFRSLAIYMVELASLEFDKIGRLDRVQPDGPHFIAPFAVGDIFDAENDHAGELGPFSSVHEYLVALLDARRARSGNDPKLALLRMFVGALVDPRYDAAPFHLGHPDLEIQNIILDPATGEVAALIDWDGVSVGGRQLSALSYPMWLTVDWDPMMYDPEGRAGMSDSEEDLRLYRQMYEDAVDAASGGALACVTRNSQVPACLEMAIASELVSTGILFHLGKYVFGSGLLTLDVLDGIEHSGWYSRTSPDDVVMFAKSGVGTTHRLLRMTMGRKRMMHLSKETAAAGRTQKRKKFPW